MESEHGIDADSLDIYRPGHERGCGARSSMVGWEPPAFSTVNAEEATASTAEAVLTFVNS